MFKGLPEHQAFSILFHIFPYLSIFIQIVPYFSIFFPRFIGSTMAKAFMSLHEHPLTSTYHQPFPSTIVPIVRHWRGRSPPQDLNLCTSALWLPPGASLKFQSSPGSQQYMVMGNIGKHTSKRQCYFMLVETDMTAQVGWNSIFLRPFNVHFEAAQGP